MGVCKYSIFCCTLIFVHSSIEITLIGKRGLVALLNFVFLVSHDGGESLLTVSWGCLWFVTVVFPDHTYLLFFKYV